MTDPAEHRQPTFLEWHGTINQIFSCPIGSLSPEVSSIDWSIGQIDPRIGREYREIGEITFFLRNDTSSRTKQFVINTTETAKKNEMIKGVREIQRCNSDQIFEYRAGTKHWKSSKSKSACHKFWYPMRRSQS
jgi:hypothetical protein